MTQSWKSERVQCSLLIDMLTNVNQVSRRNLKMRPHYSTSSCNKEWDMSYIAVALFGKYSLSQHMFTIWLLAMANVILWFS